MIELSGGDPFHFADVAAGVGFTGDTAAEEIDEYVVVLCATLWIGENAVEDIENLADFDVQAGFLESFTGSPVTQLLAEFEHPAGDRPLSFEGFRVATNQQGAVVVENDGSDADDGLLGVKALHGTSFKSPVSSFK